MPLPTWLARVNRSVTNPVARRFAGTVPGFAIVQHRGRNSGRRYRTPVSVFRQGDIYRFALTYGPDAEWVKNVLAAGRFDIETQGTTVALVAPSLYEDPAISWTAPRVVRTMLKAIGATYVLECTRDRSRAPVKTAHQDRSS